MNQHRIGLVMIVAVLLLACALPTQKPTATPEPTATNTSTAMPTATNTPTIVPTTPPATACPELAEGSTPEPTPTAPPPSPTPATGGDLPEIDLSAVQVQVDDLPSGFMPVDLRMFGMPGFEEFVENPEEIENYVSLVSMFPLEVIISFLTQATSHTEQEQMEAYFEDPQSILDQVSAQMGAPKEQEILTNAPTIGERSTAVQVVLTMGEQDFEVEMVVFGRGSVAVFVIDTHLYGAEPAVSVYDTAALLDKRLQAALGPADQ